MDISPASKYLRFKQFESLYGPFIIYRKGGGSGGFWGSHSVSGRGRWVSRIQQSVKGGLSLKIDWQ